MTQLSEAIARYHRILEEYCKSGTSWLADLQEVLSARHLVINGRPISPVLRPHFLTRRQYSNLAAATESLSSAIERVRAMAIADQQLMARLIMLPGERMLASLDPGYSLPAVTSMLEANVTNGHLHLSVPRADLPRGVIYGDALAGIFLESPPMKEFRKRYKVSRPPSAKPLAASLLKAWKDFGGTRKPAIAIVDFHHAFATAESQEDLLLAEFLRAQGLQAEIVSPDDLEYRNGALSQGAFAIDLILRGIRAQDLLTRYDLTHPLMRACRERRVCLVNSFRTEMTRKRALFALLTDDAVTASFPASERKAIRETIPLTRVVTPAKTMWQGETIDLVEFIRRNRERLVLRPNEDSSQFHSTIGALVDDGAWERALQIALRQPYVVQEHVDQVPISFPMQYDGALTYRDMVVEVAPHAFLGKVHGCSARIAPPGGGFSSLAGIAPALILEPK